MAAVHLGHMLWAQKEEEEEEEISTCFGQETAHHQKNVILYISATGISPLKLAEEASRG